MVLETHSSAGSEEEDGIAMEQSKSRVLVIGATGHLGRYIALTSAALHHPTFALVRPSTMSTKQELISSFICAGITILEGSLEDVSSLMGAVKQVDIVIAAVARECLIDQLNIIDSIKQVGTIKRFVPSEFGLDPDHVQGIGTFRSNLEARIKIRRAIEEARIPHTCISSFGFAQYFFKNLMQPDLISPPRDRIVIYGDGNVTAVFVSEQDVALFTLKIAEDPRTLNKTVLLRPPENILSQNEVVALWEEKIGKKLEKVFLTEEELLKQIEGLPYPQNVYPSFTYTIFLRGGYTKFELGPKDVEASTLYPDLQCTSAEKILEQYL